MSLVVNIIFGLLSIVLISISARNAITSISNYAKNTGISNYLIGFLVVSIGTTLPELSTAIVGSLAGQSKILLGNLIGANILDITVILGITAIVGKKITIHGKSLQKTVLTILLLVILPLVLGLDGKFSRFDGIILLGAFGGYVYRLLRKEKTFGKIKTQVPFKKLWKDMLIFLASLIALLLSARWLLISSLHIANELNVPLFAMGLFFVAIGTTIPELTVSIRSVMKGLPSIAFGDLLGAVVANSTLVLGLAAVIHPIVFDRGSFVAAAMFMITSVFIGLLFLNKKEITWKEGIGLILVYATFVVTQGFLI